jgi:signal transduction histidine kinase
VEALRQHVARWSSIFGIPVDTQLEDVPVEMLDTRAALEVVRVTQEALTNIAKHAGATQVEVSLVHGGGRLVLCIVDDGCGMQKDAGQASPVEHMGSVTMRHRIEALGGRFLLVSSPVAGVCISAMVPLNQASQ